MLCLKCLQTLKISSHHYGLHPECFREWFGDVSLFSNLTRRSADSENTYITTYNNSFFHGKFKKYSAELNSSRYILKMKEPEAPELPQVEYLCNQIGRMLKIPVAEFYIINFNDELTFVTRNFITNAVPTDLQHIYHFRSDHKHECEELINIVAERTKRPYDVTVLINTILFDALIGNHDRHGRNLAFIVKTGQLALSPIYDNVTYLSLEQGNMLLADFNPSGKIATKATLNPSMNDYIEELKRLGHNDKIENFHSIIHLQNINDLISNSFCSVPMQNAIRILINKRYKELSNAI